MAKHRTQSRNVELTSERTPLFEEFIAHVSGRFINLEAANLKTEIDQTLADFGRLMEVDRCFVFLPTEDGEHHQINHIWSDQEISPNPEIIGLIVQDTFPWLLKHLNGHEDIVVTKLDDIPDEGKLEREYCLQRGIQSFVMCPMFSRDTIVGMIGLDAIQRPVNWSEEQLRRLRLIGDTVAGAILRQRKDEEIRRLTHRLKAENEYLRSEISVKFKHEEIVGDCNAIKHVLRQVEQVAPTDSTVLILGETGTGKELLARAIHQLSPRRERSLVSMNCAALSSTLIEAELFGREKGAYTGAVSKQVGRFEIADGSSIFLDEVGELPLEIQAKLLRVLQSGEFERLGCPDTRQVDVRVIAATNLDLDKAVEEGRFRQDLFYRLNVFPIEVPPLRDRPQDIPAMTWKFVEEFADRMGKAIDTVPKEIIQKLQHYHWPGNIRELRNVIERAVIVSSGSVLNIDLPKNANSGDGKLMALADAERDHILHVLEITDGRIKGKNGAAEILDVKPSTLQSKMVKLGIERPAR